MRYPRRHKNGRTTDKTEALVTALDHLAEFEEFREKVLPAIRNDINSGMTEKELLEKHAKVAAAALITLATKLDAPAVALAAAKDILDRTQGKAVERREVAHRLGKLPDEQLDALLLTEMGENGEE